MVVLVEQREPRWEWGGKKKIYQTLICLFCFRSALEWWLVLSSRKRSGMNHAGETGTPGCTARNCRHSIKPPMSLRAKAQDLLTRRRSFQEHPKCMPEYQYISLCDQTRSDISWLFWRGSELALNIIGRACQDARQRHRLRMNAAKWVWKDGMKFELKLPHTHRHTSSHTLSHTHAQTHINAHHSLVSACTKVEWFESNALSPGNIFTSKGHQMSQRVHKDLSWTLGCIPQAGRVAV